MIKYRIYNDNGYEETLVKPKSGEYETIEFTPVDTKIEELKQQKLYEIKKLESQITNRRIREAILTGDYEFINDIENKINELRKELK